MSIPQTVIDFLAENKAAFEVHQHPHSETSLQTAIASRIDPALLAKAVLLHDDEGYFLAVLPASRRIHFKILTEQFGHQPDLVDEEDLPRTFPDCERGAVPALGTAYGLDCVVDTTLKDQPEIYLEAGDHDEVICLDGETFSRLMKGARWEAISEPAEI